MAGSAPARPSRRKPRSRCAWRARQGHCDREGRTEGRTEGRRGGGETSASAQDFGSSGNLSKSEPNTSKAQQSLRSARWKHSGKRSSLALCAARLVHYFAATCCQNSEIERRAPSPIPRTALSASRWLQDPSLAGGAAKFNPKTGGVPSLLVVTRVHLESLHLLQ